MSCRLGGFLPQSRHPVSVTDPIRNADALADGPAARTALACVAAGIEAAAPARVVRESLSREGDRLRVRDRTYDLAEYDRVVVLGGGKAAVGAARALSDVLGDRLDGGLVVAPTEGDASAVEVAVGGHPVPTADGAAATERLLDSARAADERTLVLAPVTGGASALLAAPADGLTVDDLRATTRALLDAGADIDEINAVRKHCSAVKGGGLARAATPATVVTLLFSDVVGDDPAVIGSGPTAPDPSTYAEAVAVLDRYEVDVPAAVRDHLSAGADGERRETPTAGDPAFASVDTHLLASTRTAIDAAAEAAADRGSEPLVLSSRMRGEAREIAKSAVAIAEEAAATGQPVAPPAVLLAGGETTVTVRGSGVGGPNLEYALSAALELHGGDEEIVVAAVDTDGLDGSTDVAGALVDGDTVADADAARQALAENDALPVLREADAVIETGPTGTNVNDLHVVVVT